METIQAIEIHPRERRVCYAKLPRRIENFYEKIYREGWNLKQIRFNLSGDFDTVIDTKKGHTFSLYGNSQYGKTYVTNFNLQQTELANTTTTIKSIEENILW